MPRRGHRPCRWPPTLDEADAALASSGLFGDAAIMTLRSLVNEGHRLRIQLSALHALLRQTQRPGTRPSHTVSC